VAAALMQTNSILDGVDGELARVRFEGSRLGQWLDTIGDDASNVLFWAALGFGARHIPGYGEWLAWAGWLTAAANGLAALQYYRQLVLVGSGDLYALQDDTAASSNALVTVIGYLLKQDFFLMLTLVLALAGVLHWALPVTALGALVTLGNATVRGIALRRRSDAR
jgi:phosphatidylglycerophosphate synthase